MPQRGREQGFTLVELLVVILIIAVLATIAIPVFLAQRKRGWVSQMESTLKNAATIAESYAAANGGNYVGLTLSSLQTEGFQTTRTITYSVTVDPAPSHNYCVQVTHPQLGTTKPMAISTQQTFPAKGTCTDGLFTPADWTL